MWWRHLDRRVEVGGPPLAAAGSWSADLEGPALTFRKSLGASIFGLCLGLSACSGGNPDVTPVGVSTTVPGVLKVVVTDAFGSAVAGATVTGTSGGIAVQGTTDAAGVALVAVTWPDGVAEVVVSRDSFVTEALSVTVSSGQISESAVDLDRKTAASGGTLGPPPGPGGSGTPQPPEVSEGGQQISFEVVVVAVGADGGPLGPVTVDSFSLLPCTPDTSTPASDCLLTTNGADIGYIATPAGPTGYEVTTGSPAQPYALSLLMDQSGSILQSDPTRARLFAAKLMLDALQPGSQALLAAFAGGADALIPMLPLTVYPPYRVGGAARDYFAQLDELVGLVAGDTPLLAAIDALREVVVADSSVPAGVAKAIVVFTDGTDTTCGAPSSCEAARERTIEWALRDDVRLFTIALSPGASSIEFLEPLAVRTGGAMFTADSPEALLSISEGLGQLLDNSMPSHRLRFTVRADAPGAFVPGTVLLGRVQVRSGNQTLVIPVTVRLP